MVIVDTEFITYYLYLRSIVESYREDWLELAQQERIIAVIRSTDLNIGRKMAHAVAAGGIKLIEITTQGNYLQNPNLQRPWELIELLRSELPECSIGTGTVLSLADVRDAIACGAEYIFTPHVDLNLLQAATTAAIPMIPGALTPTEIITAWQAGATAVKVFPIGSVGGINYLQALQAPLGQIPLIPTGGVTVANAANFLAAGAVAVGLGGSLFPPAEIIREDWHSIRDRSTQLVMSVKS
jgi:2-dehydro-3-deoxyphosphogluconate aldolase / (4S)-4-hydroxy-2-oxoglutarate aldolase